MKNLNMKMKMTLKFKINLIRLYLGLIIYPIKPSPGIFILIKSRETILLNTGFTSLFSTKRKFCVCTGCFVQENFAEKTFCNWRRFVKGTFVRRCCVSRHFVKDTFLYWRRILHRRIIIQYAELSTVALFSRKLPLSVKNLCALTLTVSKGNINCL
jgi:hypothetical protein